MGAMHGLEPLLGHKVLVVVLGVVQGTDKAHALSLGAHYFGWWFY